MKVYPVCLLSLLAAAHSSAVSGYGAGVDPIALPIKVAEGKHTFADAKGKSFFWFGTTQWELLFNAMQVWNAVEKIYPMLTADDALKPVKPTLMAEGAYEAGEEYGFAVMPLWVRRQAYYSYLVGGHHSVKPFTTPEGWEDSVLVLQSVGGLAKAISGAEAAAPPHAVPMVHATDLFRPPNDPDDHWDLACVYALAFQGRIDLKGVLIDFPPSALRTDPDVSAVAQLNYLTGQAVPALVGASRTISREQAKDAALQGDLRGIRAVIEMLRRSPQPVVLNVVGSTRDIAIAGGLEPELFAKKCAGIYLNAGAGSPDKAKTKRLEYNVGLDTASYAAIFHLPCPVYWMPCFEVAGEFRVAEFGTFYQFRQDLVLPHLSDRLQNFFAFLYQRRPQPNWLQYVLAPREAPLLAQQGTLSRNMWCTAGFLHAAGLTVSRDGRILPRAEADDAVFSFDPIRIQCAPDGVTQWTPDATATNRFIFHVRDLQNYPSAMISALRSLLAQLP